MSKMKIFAFPFEQNVYLSPFLLEDDYSYRNENSFSCTDHWLFQYYQEAEYFESTTRKLRASNFTACRFEHLLKLRNKSHFHFLTINKNTTSFSSFDKLLVFELDLVILAPLLSVFAILTNLTTIVSIFDKNNKKIMREKHYIYMSLHCVCNISICIIQLTSVRIHLVFSARRFVT